MKDNVQMNSKHIGFFMSDQQNGSYGIFKIRGIWSLSVKLTFFRFFCHTFVISKPIFKIYQWKMFVLRSCIQVKYLVLNYYHANIVSRAFPWRSPCWPLSPTRQQKTGAYSDTIHHQCSKFYVVFPKICTYIPAKFKLDCDITGHRCHTLDDIIEDVIM